MDGIRRALVLGHSRDRHRAGSFRRFHKEMPSYSLSEEDPEPRDCVIIAFARKHSVMH